MSVLSFNSRIGTTSNLPTGATYDLLLISFPDGFPQSQLTFTIDNEPRKVTGVQKCAQMFLKLLFTSKGSNIISPNQGTYFSNYIKQANKIGSDNTLTSEIQAQVRDATSQTQAILNVSGSDTASQLASITVLGLDVGDESIVMYLSMVTKAGVTASIAVPFPQLDMVLTDQTGS
jgi:phage baseplate assembly protein W